MTIPKYFHREKQKDNKPTKKLVKLNKLREFFEKKGYNLQFNILFEEHYDPATYRALKELLPAADIYIPESIRWRKIDLIVMNGISRGKFEKNDLEKILDLFKKEPLAKLLSSNAVSALLIKVKATPEDIIDILIESYFQEPEILDDLVLSKISFLELFVNKVKGKQVIEFLNLKEEISKILKIGKELNEKDIENISEFFGYLEYGLQSFKIIKGTKKPIVIVDLPLDHPLEKKISEVLEASPLHSLNPDNYPPMPDENFDQLLENIINSIEKYSELMQERENYMLEQLPKTIDNLLNEHPELQQKALSKEGIKILLNLGAVHTRIFHKLEETGIPTKRKFTKMPFVYSLYPEILRKYVFVYSKLNESEKSKYREKIQELAAKSLAEAYFTYEFYRLSSLSYITNLSSYLRTIISQLTLNDVRHIFEELKKIREGKITALDIWSKYININHPI
ncbi:MAG: hypothetical protein KatS3mg097_355 [Candidatus Parcubacteria bacterium]|nr:MAG: hypothetical protein KatS3mg097_355 [Candidatus Parcubacteria bacterium]